MIYYYLVPPRVVYEKQDKWQVWRVVHLKNMDYEFAVADVQGQSHLEAFEAFKTAVVGVVPDGILFVCDSNIVHHAAAKEFESFSKANGIHVSETALQKDDAKRCEAMMNALEEVVKRHCADLYMLERRELSNRLGM